MPSTQSALPHQWDEQTLFWEFPRSQQWLMHSSFCNATFSAFRIFTWLVAASTIFVLTCLQLMATKAISVRSEDVELALDLRVPKFFQYSRNFLVCFVSNTCSEHTDLIFRIYIQDCKLSIIKIRQCSRLENIFTQNSFHFTTRGKSIVISSCRKGDISLTWSTACSVASSSFFITFCALHVSSFGLIIALVCVWSFRNTRFILRSECCRWYQEALDHWNKYVRSSAFYPRHFLLPLRFFQLSQ